MSIPESSEQAAPFNGFRSLCSVSLFLAALGGGALCQIRSKLRISTRDHIFEHEFSKKKFQFYFYQTFNAMVILQIIMMLNKFENLD